jgi:putative exporter of polyketide antibiotics
MEDTRIVLSGLWVAVMLTYLLGDVLRIFAGDFEAEKMAGGFQPTQAMWLLIAVIMLIPIVMLVLSLILKYPAIRWVNIIAAIFLVVFNLFGLPYKGTYDNFLIIVSFVFNGLIIWYAWKWPV